LKFGIKNQFSTFEPESMTKRNQIKLNTQNLKTMRSIYAIVLGAILAFATTGVKAQEVSTGVDIYSSYIWRGAKFGTGAAIQPSVEFSAGGLALGAWGSVSTGGTEAFEMDLYASYSFGFGLTLAVTDYYFGGKYFEGPSHFIEPSVSFEAGNFSLLAAYMMGDGLTDTYAQAGYTLGSVDLFVGAGNGQYTSDGNFMVCNVGIGTSKEIKITDSFSIPVSGSVSLNPSTQGFFIAVGVSF
jgi:hypothetical protein